MPPFRRLPRPGYRFSRKAGGNLLNPKPSGWTIEGPISGGDSEGV